MIAYVRGPRSYVASAFQQTLKGQGIPKLNSLMLMPGYRARFSQLDEIFGQDSVILRPYARKRLVGGDVVRDFSKFLGITIQTLPQPEANTTLSAEATALLYVQRRLGNGFVAGFPEAERGNKRFLEALRRISGNKLGFTDKLWSPMVEANLADLAWIEKRLGQPLPDEPSSNAVELTSEQDLIELAVASEEKLLAIVPKLLHSRECDPLKRVTATLEALREQCYEQERRKHNASSAKVPIIQGDKNAKAD